MNSSYYDDNENRSLKIALAFVRFALRALLVVLVIMGIIYLSKKIYSVGYEAFSAKPVAANEEEGKYVTVVITKKMSLKDIAELLNNAGLINESDEAFMIQARSYGYADSLIPGPYVLNTSMTVEEMLEFMSTPRDDEQKDDGGQPSNSKV